MSCGVGRRYGSDPALLWLWRRPAATAPTGPLVWEPPYAVGVALKRTKRQKKSVCVYIYIYTHTHTHVTKFKKQKIRHMIKSLPPTLSLSHPIITLEATTVTRSLDIPPAIV